MEEHKMIFANRLRQAMQVRNMNQTQLCCVTGIPKSAMIQYVNGLFKPKHDRLEMIAKALSVNEAWLMGYYGVEMERKRGNSMEDYKNLIERLHSYKSMVLDRVMIDDALSDSATAIETLLAERDKALEELKDLKIMWDMFGGSEGITDAFQKAAERDAAVENIDRQCFNCCFYENDTNSEPCLSCTSSNNHWEWCGPEKGDAK